MGWERKHWPAGTLVEVMSVDDKRLGVGKLLNDYDGAEKSNEMVGVDEIVEAVEEGIEDDSMPRIEMPDGKVIYGYECWWIPVVVTRNAGLENEEHETH